MPWPGPGSENEKANITEEEVKDDDGSRVQFPAAAFLCK